MVKLDPVKLRQELMERCTLRRNKHPDFDWSLYRVYSINVDGFCLGYVYRHIDREKSWEAVLRTSKGIRNVVSWAKDTRQEALEEFFAHDDVLLRYRWLVREAKPHLWRTEDYKLFRKGFLAGFKCQVLTEAAMEEAFEVVYRKSHRYVSNSLEDSSEEVDTDG